MGYLRRLLLINSAGYPFADIRLDGHCSMAGGQGVGKTTLMNAILFPFVVEDHLLDIDKYEKTRFSLYYFPEQANSFVIYEVVNSLNEPYTVFIHRIGQALDFEFIHAPFDIGWLYNGDEQVKDWQEVRAKLKDAGIYIKQYNTMKEFNEIILGKGSRYNKQYSLIKSPINKDAIRPLLSAIFKNRPFTQETLKEALVSAVLSTNEVNSDIIELSSYRKSLNGFMERYNDIRKMTVKRKDGKTVIEELAEGIFEHVGSLNDARIEKNKIPGLLKYAIPKASCDIESLTKEIGILKEKLNNLSEEWERQEKLLDEEIQKLASAEGAAEKELKDLAALSKKYREAESGLDDLADWCLYRDAHEEDLRAVNAQIDDLTADSRELRNKMDNAIADNDTVYDKKALLLQQACDTEVKRHSQTITDSLAKETLQKAKIEDEYSQILGADWKEVEIRLIDDLVTLSSLLANAETLDDVREAISTQPNADVLSSVLTKVLFSRNGEDNADIAILRQKVEDARDDFIKELDRKVVLENKKKSVLAEIESRNGEVRKKANEAIMKAKASLEVDLENNEGQREKAAETIRKEYEAKIHGNDPVLQSALEDLCARRGDLEHIISQIKKYPTAAEDKKLLAEEPAKKKQHDVLLHKLSELRQKKLNVRSAYKEEEGTLTAKKLQCTSNKEAINSAWENAMRFLDGVSSLRAAYEEASQIETEKRLPDIINDYNALNERISEEEAAIRQSVPRLYGPGMLSRTDTFQLGIGINDSLSTLDDYLSVATKLKMRLENSEDEAGLDQYIRVETNIWMDVIRNISGMMSPIESMLMQIQKLCRKASEFVKKNNRTDCIESFKMEIDENDCTDLVRLFRDTARFSKEKGAFLGFDTLFASEDDSVNKEAIALLEKVSLELDNTRESSIPISSMFNIRMDVKEKGVMHNSILSFNNIGSKGTANVLKAMLNITLLHVILGDKQAANSRLICAIDEMNTIEAANLDALKSFANEARMFIFGSGQHHTQTALDYIYNVWDERDRDGRLNKWISMDAEEVEKEVEA